MTRTPSPSAASGPAEGAHLAPAHPGHEEEPRDRSVEPAALEGDLAGLDAAAAGRWRGRRPGPPVADEDPGGAFVPHTGLFAGGGEILR